MSRTVTDEDGPQAGTDTGGRERAADRSVVRRTIDRMCAGVRRWAGAIRERIGGDDPVERSLDVPDLPGNPDAADASRLVVAANGNENENGDGATPLPERDRALTRPPDGESDAGPPDLVAHVESGELTLELPDQPGATITSDVWERVER